VGCCLKRRYRLSDKERFRQVRQDGESFRHSLLVLCVLPNGQTFSRCGFTASRRLGHAVSRNLARRRMSEAVRQVWDLILPGWDMVWVGRSGINVVQFSELQEACVQLLRRAHLLRTEP
jgi:ribonuclease P protein component